MMRSRLFLCLVALLGWAIPLGAVEILRVDPAVVSTEGGTTVTFTGSGFSAGMTPRLGGVALTGITFLDATRIRGSAPRLVAGMHMADLMSQFGVVIARRIDAVEAISPSQDPRTPPGPQQIETSFAEGTARFHWTNPQPYRKIIVTSRAATAAWELPGDATFFEVPGGSAEEVDLSFQGVLDNELRTRITDAIAKRHECPTPPALVYHGTPGEVDFFLRGGHAEAQVMRCSAPQPVAPDGAGAALGADGQAAGDGGGAAAPGPDTTGRVVTAYDIDVILQGGRPDKLVTGFTLEQDADRLEFGLYYEKLATDFGLHLRGHLVHVHPDDGFEDEFTFPDVRINEGKRWNYLTYFRAEQDAGSDDPTPCQLKIPAGRYRLEIYAVGGDPKLPYYRIASDSRENEIPIEGVPCPPYPLARVSDMTGFRILPRITEVTGINNGIAPGDLFDYLQVQFAATGKWYDEAGNEHSIVPGDPDYVPTPDFEYEWKILDVAPPRTVLSNGNTIDTYVKDWGCYKVDITVSDRACGSARTFSFEVPIIPQPLECNSQFNSFKYPTPDPGGIYGVVGLDPPGGPPGNGSFEGPRPISFRVLVAPSCACNPDVPEADCPAAEIGMVGSDGCKENKPGDHFRFRLAVPLIDPVHHTVTYVDLNAPIIVCDLCINRTTGAKYFMVTVPDIGAIPTNPLLEGLNFRRVYIQAKTFKRRLANGTEQTVNDNGPNGGWYNVGSGLWLVNRPDALEDTFWTGHFNEADESYHFVVKSSQNTEKRFDIGPSASVDILGLTEIPSMDNDLSAGFTARFMTSKGVWQAEPGPGTLSGQLLSNAMEGAPVQVAPQESTVAGLAAGDGGGSGLSLPSYSWCDHSEIFKNSFSTKLFESIIYTGSIGPVPVTIWGSIQLGLDFLIESYITSFLTPFAPLTGEGTFSETHFYLLSSVGIRVPCEVRADVAGGIINIAIRMIPEAVFRCDTHISNSNLSPDAKLFLQALFNLTMEIEGCVDVLLTEICASVDVPLVEGVELIPTQGCDPRPIVTCDNPDVTPGDENCGGGSGEPLAADGGGAGVVPVFSRYMVTSAPVMAVSPDGQTLITVSFDEQGFAHIAVDDADVFESPDVGGFLDPSAVFLTNDRALVAWTRSICEDLPNATLCSPDPDQELTLAERNEVTRMAEIVVTPIVRLANGWQAKFNDTVRIADVAADGSFLPLADRRADGKGSLSANLTPAAIQAGGEAVAAWVHYETPDYLVQDGTQTRVYERRIGSDGKPFFEPQDVDTVRPQMELTAVYARLVDATGALGARVRLSPPGINIEPVVSFSPAGGTAICVWVHDSTPGHKDLITSNRGRTLLYSVYNAAAGTWSAPASAIANPDNYPGLLEPYILLDGDASGLLAFTALDVASPERDTGLGGGSRYVYVSHLENGVFSEPVRIHGKCEKREYGHWVKIYTDLPDLVDPMGEIHHKLPDWVITWQGHGEVGTRAGAGDVMVSAFSWGAADWTAPRSLTPDDSIHSNIATAFHGGSLKALYLNGGPALLAERGAGLAPEGRRFERLSAPMLPDLAVSRCDLSNPFPAPGSRVQATVEVSNLGLAGSAVDSRGRSPVGVHAKYIAQDGTERFVWRESLPAIPPGVFKRFEFTVELPHDPVRLRVELTENATDSDATNDVRECFFGAPAPRQFRCESILANNEEETLSARLTWTNAALYDELFLYRDGKLLATLPGSATSFADHYARTGLRTYVLRGRMGVSKSARVKCVFDHQPPQPEGLFRRGDANADGEMNITDPIFALNYLFNGGPAPVCEKAADADDTGDVIITDAIYSLTFLFLGGPSPRPPFPRCGDDPTADTLGCISQPTCQ